MTPYFETDRLAFYPPTLEDADIFLNIQTSMEAMRYIGRGPRNAEQAQMLLMGCVYHQLHFGFSLGVVKEKGGNTSIGQAGIYHFNLIETDPRIEVAFAFLEPFWGKGYATESVQGFQQWAASRWGITELVAVAHPKNKASVRVLEKSGFSFLKMSKREGRPVRYYKYKQPG